ncbi:MAG TPA: hypothetical protein PLR99_11370, partial [Polyangiaceae bacterium]|nr:hypothetical protein [Polyangiaceae bacterium]
MSAPTSRNVTATAASIFTEGLEVGTEIGDSRVASDCELLGAGPWGECGAGAECGEGAEYGACAECGWCDGGGRWDVAPCDEGG